MVNDAFLHRRILFLSGALLTITSSFLPWKCVGDFFSYCSAGINFNLAATPLISFDEAVITAMIITIGAFLLNGIDRVRPWRKEAVAAWILSILWYFLIRQSFVKDNGGLAVAILCSLALWCIFRLPDFSAQANKAATITMLAILVLLTFHLARIGLAQFAEREIIGGTSLAYGLFAAFAGSVLMLAMHLWIVSAPRL